MYDMFTCRNWENSASVDALPFDHWFEWILSAHDRSLVGS